MRPDQRPLGRPASRVVSIFPYEWWEKLSHSTIHEGLPFPNGDHSVCQDRYRESRENQKWHQNIRISYRSRGSFDISIIDDAFLFQLLSQTHTTLAVWDWNQSHTVSKLSVTGKLFPPRKVINKSTLSIREWKIPDSIYKGAIHWIWRNDQSSYFVDDLCRRCL